MSTLKSLFFILVTLSICVASCSDREDAFPDITGKDTTVIPIDTTDTTHVIPIDTTDTTHIEPIDTTDVFVTFQLKKADGTILSHNNNYEYTISLKAGITSLFSYSIDKASDCVFKVGYEPSKEEFGISATTRKISYKGFVSGTSTVTIEIADPWKRKQEVKLNITNKANEKPVPALTITHSVLEGVGYLIKLDASSSYDQDAALGGKIVQYKYVINGIGTVTQSDKIYYDTIPSPGLYYIDLEVMDNNNEWGTKLSKDHEIKDNE